MEFILQNSRYVLIHKNITCCCFDTFHVRTIRARLMNGVIETVGNNPPKKINNVYIPLISENRTKILTVTQIKHTDERCQQGLKSFQFYTLHDSKGILVFGTPR